MPRIDVPFSFQYCFCIARASPAQLQELEM